MSTAPKANRTTHTPGPWSVHDQTDLKPPRVWVRRTDTFAVARVMTGQQLGIHRDEVIANARLIAAAPELYDALEALLQHVGYTHMDDANLQWEREQGNEFIPFVQAARAALAKAAGK